MALDNEKYRELIAHGISHSAALVLAQKDDEPEPPAPQQQEKKSEDK